MKQRCAWVGNDPMMQHYHDKEWGTPVHEERTWFEFLALETFQAGLSWSTILKKRKNFKKAFNNFNYKGVAKFTKKDINRLMQDESIIRNRLKIESTISNAKAFLNIQKEYGSFNNYMWGFTGGGPIKNKIKTIRDIPTRTKLSDTISKDLKKHSFRFVGPTIVYAHMQATGMVNDHEVACFRYKELY